MSNRSGSELIRAVYDAINDRNLDGLDDLFSSDYVDQQDGHWGIDAFKGQLRVFFEAFPDIRITLDEVVAEGDRCASRTTATGTNTGSLMGMAPTGKAVSVGAVDIVHIRDGRAAERWGGLDTYSLLVQLGVIPAPQPA
jgi:predicted ester cyclase